jgi:hypothetical protein
MTSTRNERHMRRRGGLLTLGVGVILGALFVAFTGLSSSSVAAPQVAPVNTQEPSIEGTARVGQVLQGDRGDWVGAQSFEYRWMRCDPDGSAPNASDCAPISEATGTNYRIRNADRGFRLRFRVTASNADGSTIAASNPTNVVQPRDSSGTPPPQPEPPSGTLDVGSLQAAGDRLVVSQVQFSPNPVTSRTDPITARVRVTARGGRSVRGATVFMRGTPRVVQGQTVQTQGDGWATLTLVPNRLFPQPRSGFNVQFFIKASRPGDPALGGIAGYRLVQVRLAG